MKIIGTAALGFFLGILAAVFVSGLYYVGFCIDGSNVPFNMIFGFFLPALALGGTVGGVFYGIGK